MLLGTIFSASQPCRPTQGVKQPVSLTPGGSDSAGQGETRQPRDHGVAETAIGCLLNWGVAEHGSLVSRNPEAQIHGDCLLSGPGPTTG